MNKKQFVPALLGLIVLGVLLTAYILKQPASKPEGAGSPSVGELIFDQSLMITADSIAIDGGELKPVQCGPDGVTIGTLRLDTDTIADITCSTEYLGGVNMSYLDSGGARETVNLAQQDGDAGDLWDTRSLITRARDGRLIVETISLSSSESIDVGKDQPASCSVRQEALVWDPSANVFTPAEGPGEFYLSRFTPPINVVNDCLDAKGLWRGTADAGSR